MKIHLALAATLTSGIAQAKELPPKALCPSLQTVLFAAGETPTFKSQTGKATSKFGYEGKIAIGPLTNCRMSRLSNEIYDKGQYSCDSAKQSEAAAVAQVKALQIEVGNCLYPFKGREIPTLSTEAYGGSEMRWEPKGYKFPVTVSVFTDEIGTVASITIDVKKK